MNQGDTDGKKKTTKKTLECDRKGESGWSNETENSRRGGGWERDERETGGRGGWAPSPDWLPPLARSTVLRLAAAPERSHIREGGGGAATLPELLAIHTDLSPHETRCWFCSWKREYTFCFTFFLHVRLNNAALSARRGQGFTAVFYSHVKKRKK